MNLEKRKIIRVSEVMKTEVDIVDGMMTVSEALKSLKYPETHTMIVDKRHEDDEYGVVMFRDIALQVLAPNLSPDRISIYEIMSKPVLSVLSTMPVPYAARFMTNFDVSYAMVTENNKVIGLVSLNGIVSCWKGQ